MHRVKWLLVGAGAVSQKRVAPALARAANSEIVAVCDVQENQARHLASEHGIQDCFYDFDRALSRTDADAVYIATPVWLHVQQAIKALEAGKHVLVEKPLGLNGAESTRLVDAGRLSDKKSACAYFRRFFPRYQHTEEMLSSGELGQIVSARMVFNSWYAPEPGSPAHWRVTKSKSGGGPLSDMGSHMFDVLVGLFDLPISVFARCENLVHQWDVEDCASVLMKLKNGAQVVASFNWNSKTWRHEFEIVGTEARVNWLPYDMGPVVKAVGRETQSIDMPNADNVHLPLIEDFVQAIIHDRLPKCPLEEAAKTNLLLDSIYRSSTLAREVCLSKKEGC